MGALVLSPLLAAADVPPAPRVPVDPPSLAARINLTLIAVLQAEYARAARERNASDLAEYDRLLVTMLQDEVLAYASDEGAPSGGNAGGTGGGAAALGRDTARTPAVAVDEEEVGAAGSLDAQVVNLAREFMSLEGKSDDTSVTRKSSLIASLVALSEEAHFPGSTDTTQRREGRRQYEEERLEREQREKLPVGSGAAGEAPPGR